MKFCTKCGAKINDGDKFCIKCGNPLSNGRDDVARQDISDFSRQNEDGEFNQIDSMQEASSYKKSKVQRKKLYAIIATVAAGAVILLIFLVLGSQKPLISTNREPLKGYYAVTSIEGGSSWFEDGIFSDLGGDFEPEDAPILVECESNRVTFYLTGTDEILAVGYWKDDELEIDNIELEGGGTMIDVNADIYLDTNEDSLYREIVDGVLSDDEEFLLASMKYSNISSDEETIWNMFFYFPHRFDSFVAHVEPIDKTQLEEYLNG